MTSSPKRSVRDSFLAIEKQLEVLTDNHIDRLMDSRYAGDHDDDNDES